VTTDGPQLPTPQRVPDLLAVPAAEPAPVPDLPSGVTDEDRNRYGVLLDHAAERGLLSPGDYQARLSEVASATSLDELKRIVTELPVFDGVGTSPAMGPGVAAAVPATSVSQAPSLRASSLQASSPQAASPQTPSPQTPSLQTPSLQTPSLQTPGPGDRHEVWTSTVPDSLDAALWANLTPATQRRGRGNPWVILGVLVVVMLVAIMVLALVASHLTHTTHAGSVEVARQTVSRLRL